MELGWVVHGWKIARKVPNTYPAILVKVFVDGIDENSPVAERAVIDGRRAFHTLQLDYGHPQSVKETEAHPAVFLGSAAQHEQSSDPLGKLETLSRGVQISRCHL